MNLDGAVKFSAAAEKSRKRKMHFNRIRIEFDQIDKGINGLVLFIAEKEIYAFVQRVFFIRDRLFLFDVKRTGKPAGREKKRNQYKVPKLKIHGITCSFL